MIRFSAGALVLLLSTGTGILLARAQDVDAPVIQKHLALIIANQDYDMDGALQTGPTDVPPPGFLKDLANPCGDADLFRQTLLKANWRPEEIVFAPCNQTAPQMRELLAEFRKKVVNSTDTIAIFYYSGHGAQFSDADTNHSFLFGVGAKLDLAALAKSFHNSPKNTSAIATEAIDLEELTGTLGLQIQNAVLIILDACRDNPLYGQIKDLENAPAIAALGAQLDFNGIVIAYSTPHGEFSGDGFKDHSIFTGALVTQLGPSKNLDSSLNSLRKAVDRAYRAAYPQRTKSQVPVVTGRFDGDWCLTQCPPPIHVVTRTFTDTIPASQLANGIKVFYTGPDLQQASFRKSVRPTITNAVAVQQTTPALRGQADPASQGLSALTQTIYDREAKKENFNTPAQAGMHFDVFWCDGGEGSDDREKRALDIASALGKEASALETASLPIIDSNGFQIKQSISSVRLRRLSAIANTGAGFRYTNDVVVYDEKNANETEWSKVISKLSGADLSHDGGSANTPNYMGIFICRAHNGEKDSKTLIYLQVPKENLKPSGHLLLKGLSHVVPSVEDAGGIETRSDGPLSTEIRFYNQEERDSVFATAKAMEQVLGKRVKVQFIPRLANEGTAGHMEIWLGRNDPALDKNALKAILPK